MKEESCGNKEEEEAKKKACKRRRRQAETALLKQELSFIMIMTLGARHYNQKKTLPKRS